jgi:hypothetical protein
MTMGRYYKSTSRSQLSGTEIKGLDEWRPEHRKAELVAASLQRTVEQI